jgi:hypothetical protein
MTKEALNQDQEGESAFTERRRRSWHLLPLFTRHRGHPAGDPDELIRVFFGHLVPSEGRLGP